MPISKDQKKEIIKKISSSLKKSKSVVFTKFSGLPVIENQELRKKLKAENSEYYVAKKTLLGLAIKDTEYKNIEIKKFDGQVGTIFGYGDEVAPAKVIDAFRKGKEEKIEFLGGILENRFISANEVAALAKLPGRQELYAKLVGSLNAPVSGFVNSLAGNLRNLVYVLKAIEEKK